MADSKELMALYCDGDGQALRELYALLAPRLLGYLQELSRDQALAADVLAHTFLKVHRARSAYIRGVDPEPWLYSIAQRTFVEFLRRRARDQT